MIIVATDKEYEIAKKRFKGQKIIKTGVGGINVVKKLKKLPKWLKLTNFGLVGSNNLPIGTEVRIGYCMHYHKTVFDEPAYIVGKKTDYMWCLTSDEFVEEYSGLESVVFDMELAYILALGFKRVESIKIVSDNLSLKQYEEEIK